MNTEDQSWEERVAALWRDATTLPADELVRCADALAGELDPGDPRASFERACARDTGGFEAEAEQHYRAALASGRLDSFRSARATIQLASTLRILGRLDESERLLVAELDRHLQPGHDRALHDEARATLALTYVAQGRAVEAAGLALSALAPRLSRYNRSVASNAAELVAQTWRRGRREMTHAPAVTVAREFWRLMAGNDFDAVAAVLAPTFVLEWPQSKERIRGAERFARMNREYVAHGAWQFAIRRLIGHGDDAVSEVDITDGVQHAKAISFFSVEDGKIVRIVEYWPEPFAARADRAHLVEALP